MNEIKIVGERFSDMKIKDDIALQLALIEIDPLNKQQCLLPLKLAAELNILPSSVVIIEDKNYDWQIIGKVLFKMDGNTLDVCPMVARNLPEKHWLNHNVSIKLYKKDLIVFRKVKVTIILKPGSQKRIENHSSHINDIIKEDIMKSLFFSCSHSIHCSGTNSYDIEKIIILETDSDFIGQLNSKTNLIISNVISPPIGIYSNEIMPYFKVSRLHDELVGLMEINCLFKSSISNDASIHPVKQILLAGPSGSGKSTLIEAIGRQFNCLVVKIVGEKIYSQDPGKAEENLRSIFEQAIQNSKNLEEIVLIHIEDVDVICPSKSSSAHMVRISAQLMQLLDRLQNVPGVMVIATSNNPTGIKSALRRQGRLSKEMYMGSLSKMERFNFLSTTMQTLNVTTDEELREICEDVADVTQGYLAADLKHVCQLVASKLNTKELSTELFKEVLLTMKPASLRNEIETIRPGTKFTDLGGLWDVKKQLEISVFWPLQHPHAFKRLGITRPKGVLLYGPPGCGKTSLVKALAARGNVTLLCSDSAAIYSPFVGDAEKAIAQLFTIARHNAPAIIFIDEIDSLIAARGSGGHISNVEEQVLTALLTQIDGVGTRKLVADSKMKSDGDDVMLVAATNKPENIDPALLRAGRLDRHIYVPPPDTETRKHILQMLLSKTPHVNVDLDSLAEKTDFYTGADLKNLHREAVLFAMQQDGIDTNTVEQHHFLNVLETLKPSLNTYLLERYQKFL